MLSACCRRPWIWWSGLPKYRQHADAAYSDAQGAWSELQGCQTHTGQRTGSSAKPIPADLQELFNRQRPPRPAAEIVNEADATSLQWDCCATTGDTDNGPLLRRTCPTVALHKAFNLAFKASR